MEESVREIKLAKDSKCEKHDLDHLYFCLEESCQVPLCPDCYIDDHFGHPKQSAKVAYEERKRELGDVLATQEKKFDKLKAQKNEQIKNIKESESKHIKENQELRLQVEKAIKAQSAQKTASIENWEKDNVKTEVEALRSIKTELNALPMVKFLKEASRLLTKAKDLKVETTYLDCTDKFVTVATGEFII